MMIEDQVDTVDFLRRFNGCADAETIVTHISMVFLAGDRALKLKRAVRSPYVDFSTAERRLAACEAELRLNRRTAPEIYLAVRLITREADGSLVLDGDGALVDAVVEMRRFAQDDLFDNLARRGALTPALMTGLARRIAALHRDAEVSEGHGGASGIAGVLDLNERSLRAASLVPPETADASADAFRGIWARHAPLLDARRDAGKVRRCHGDLILRNICLFGGRPTLFDCIEFDDDLATIDVLYDLAFLLMDLWHREQRDLANLVLNRYLDECDETDGLGLMPFFMAIRAAVRAHVTAVQALEARPEDAAPIRAEAHAYFDLARACLHETKPAPVAIGGLSGTGKSTIAALAAPHIGPAPGARILNSDRIRKHLHGVPAEARLPETAYRPELSKLVYATLNRETARAIATGTSVVVDAVFGQPEDRAAVADVAAAAGVPSLGFWLEAGDGTRLSRVRARVNDPSDATADVLVAQARRDPGPIAWRRLDAEAAAADTKDAILAEIGLALVQRHRPGLE